MFSARNGREMSYPWQVIPGPMVCIINEYAGSDGDIFPYFFREYGLGKVVGRRTWGGVVGIRLDKHLMDGGMLTMPEYGTYSLDRKWIIENRGVTPGRRGRPPARGLRRRPRSAVGQGDRDRAGRAEDQPRDVPAGAGPLPTAKRGYV